MSSQSASRGGSRYRSKALFFAGGLLVGLLASEMIRSPQAVAQIPDAALQRKKTAQQTAETNLLLREMVKILRTETLKVRVVEADKSTKGRGAKTGTR